jgi:hypothetical protein
MYCHRVSLLWSRCFLHLCADSRDNQDTVLLEAVLFESGIILVKVFRCDIVGLADGV